MSLYSMQTKNKMKKFRQMNQVTFQLNLTHTGRLFSSCNTNTSFCFSTKMLWTISKEF